jgi:hypothetical protein
MISEGSVSLPEQWASFAGPVPTTDVHTVCGYSVYATVMHQCYAFDLEPVAQADQFDAFSFRESLDLGDREDEPAPIAG